MINGFHHATFITRNLSQARNFYERVLGLRPDINRPVMSFDGVWYDVAPRQQIHLMLLPNPEEGVVRPTHGGRDRHVALSVNNLATLIQQLEQAGIVYSLSQSGRRALFCRDPDDNALEFIEDVV
jgi:catechol 2,3-dioxygenase-like lactoylglutathione lyase family enzyme